MHLTKQDLDQYFSNMDLMLVQYHINYLLQGTLLFV